VSFESIARMTESLTYNSYAGAFMLVGYSGGYVPDQRRNTWGVFYSFSRDLIHWTPRRLLWEIPAPWTYKCGQPDPIAYPSVLDGRSSSPNFETTGQRAYLYFTQLHYEGCTQNLNRDLVRVPIELVK
jgi:hypothetical protein